jgi:hypothetical protein
MGPSSRDHLDVGIGNANRAGEPEQIQDRLKWPRPPEA